MKKVDDDDDDDEAYHKFSRHIKRRRKKKCQCGTMWYRYIHISYVHADVALK